LLLADFARRGFLDGRTVRLPGIVARPLEISGLVSAFMSDVMRRLAAGETFSSPVSPEALMWWMSAKCCAQNLIHAATIPSEKFTSSRVTLLPALYATMQDIVSGIAEIFGANRLELIRYEPNEQVEAGFGRFPPMDSSAAQALGFAHDGSVRALIKNALDLEDQ
jgi:D-erythronate 2-dehydrogenase